MQYSEPINKCRVCHTAKLVEVLDLGDQPPANSLRQDKNEKLPKIPLVLLFCETCSTIQLNHTTDPKYLFDHYYWVTGTSSTAVEYSQIFCERIISRIDFTKQNFPFIVEVASNDGTFLKRFVEGGYKVLGIDPAKNVAALAEQCGIPTIAQFFNKSVASAINEQYCASSVVIARNVISHVKEIHSVIAGIADLVGENGLGVIEFHYTQVILEELQYDSIYHEHLLYFSLKTISGLLELYGLNIFDVDKSPVSGGSLVIYFTKNKRPKTPALLELEEREINLGLNDLDTWLGFARSCRKHAIDFISMLKDANAMGSVIGYGASARGSTLLNFCGLNSKDLEYIIDKNELKHGLIMPGSDIKIVPLSKTPGYFDDIGSIILLAWNLVEEIERELRNFGYSGAIILPFPNAPKVICK